jgi:hypothetical protein
MVQESQSTSIDIKKSKTKKRIEFYPYYVVMHTNNLAICMASGFLGPRFEDGAVRDHNYRSNSLILSKLPIPDNYFLEAFGDLDYGAVCVVLVSLPKSLLKTRVLPFSYVESVIFSSESDRDEFTAKLSGYSDIPNIKLPFEVDGDVFPISKNNKKINISLINEVSPDRSYYFSVDKLTGLIFGLFFSFYKLRNPKNTLLLAKFSEIDLSGLSSVEILKGINKALGLFSDSDDSFFLLERLFEYLLSIETKNGFDPKNFLNSLKTAGYADLTADHKKVIDGFCRHSLDILDLRRDLTSLEDEPGKVIPRAILLFMLSPDSNKLGSLFSMYPKLGSKVYVLTSMLIGCLAGGSRLPSEVKSFSDRSALIVPDFVFDINMGKVGLFEASSSYDENGTCSTNLLYKGESFITFRLNPDEKLVSIVGALKSAGYKTGFTKNGALVVEGVINSLPSYKITFQLIQSFWMPFKQAIKASAAIPIKSFNKTTMNLLADEFGFNDKAILTTLESLGKSYAVEISMYAAVENFTKSEAGYIFEQISSKYENLMKKLT